VAEWHLAELEEELRRAGWTVGSVSEGDGYRTAAVWEVTRGEVRHRIAFDAFDASGSGDAQPLERAYGCEVEDTHVSLYFGKKTGRRWRPELEAFVGSLASLRADRHHMELEDELRRAGWAVFRAAGGDGQRTPAVWDVTQWDAARGLTTHRIAFEGEAESGVALPPERAAGCYVEGTEVRLPFGETGCASQPDLEEFVSALSSLR
jgi:hypothetical protein